MARQPILLGTVPNGDGGDTLRQSNTKINQMTEELYATDAAQAISIQGLQDAESSASGRLDVLEQGAAGTGQAIEGLQDNLEIAQTAIGELESSREFTLVPGDNITIDRTNPLAPVISSTGGGGPGGVAWGQITGTLSDQADLQSALVSKVDKVEGKQLSTEDYTTGEKNKLTGIEEGAQVNVGTNIAQDVRTSTNVNITSSTGTGALLTGASTTEAGLMVAADKSKLEGIASGATANQTDAFLLNRANHTGSQPISSIANLQSSLDSKENTLTAGTGIVIDRTNPSAPVISSTASLAYYESSQTVWTAGGELTFTHGLGIEPKFVTVYAVMTTTVGSITEGTRFQVSQVFVGSNWTGIQVIGKTSTQIKIICGSGMYRIVTPTSATLINASQCQLIVSAQA